MKNSKIVAAMAAAALAVSMVAMLPASAATTFTENDGAFEFDDFDVLSDKDAVIVVTYTDEHDNWGDIGFGFSEGKAWKSWAATNPAGEEVTAEYAVADIVSEANIEDLDAITFGKVEGYNGCVILNVEVKAADDVTPPTDDQPTDGETTDGETTDDQTTDDQTTDDQTTDKETTDGLTTGDLDGDGRITVSDIALIAGYVKGKTELTPAQLVAADVNGKDGVNVTDISLIAAHVKTIRPLY